MNEIGVDKFSIELHEPYPCLSKEELHARENYWVRQLGTLNMVIPGRTIKQWREDNKEDQNIKRNEFETNNKGHLADYRRQYAI